MTWTRCAVRTTRAGSGERAKGSFELQPLRPGEIAAQAGGRSARKEEEAALQGANHEEAATEDINVGGYYLQTKNWKAALSRFESALVLDPENPKFIGPGRGATPPGRFCQRKGELLEAA